MTPCQGAYLEEHGFYCPWCQCHVGMELRPAWLLWSRAAWGRLLEWAGDMLRRANIASGRDDMFGKIIRYRHHGTEVSVREELQGTHRDHCLCFDCGKFKPSQEGNCAIAETLYRVYLTMPIFECPAYAKGKADLSAMPKAEP